MERHKSEGGGSKFLEFDIERDKDGGGGGNAGGKEEMVLPPTLQHLVYFWEELSLAVLKVSIEQCCL